MPVTTNPSLTLSNYYNFFSFLSPFLLVFFMIMISVFNMEIKGVIYLGGILMASIINALLVNLVKQNKNSDASPLCGLFNPFPNQDYNSPSYNSLLISFTFAYLLRPMIFNKQINYVVIIVILSLLIMEGFCQVFNLCTNVVGTILGSLVGFILGSLYYTGIYHSGYKGLLYFEEFQSNKVICKRPKKQQFKCKVFKNGELVDSTIA